jgi:hypothetical protein
MAEGSSGNILSDIMSKISNWVSPAPPEAQSTYMGDAPKGFVPDPVSDAYGSGNEGYVTGKTVNLPKTNNIDLLNPKGDDFKAYDISKPKKDQLLSTQKMLADLTNMSQVGQAGANVNALVGLGFDPRRVQGVSGVGPTTIGGKYKPSTDTIWDNTDDPNTILHESMHRGLEKLRTSGEMPQDGIRLLNNVSEESLVRHLMQTQFGPTEANYMNNLGKRLNIADINSTEGMKQINGAEYVFKHNPNLNESAVQSILDAAAKLIAKQRPGGPR